MTTPLETANRAIEEASPALWAVFSPLGRRVIFPPDIPFQAAQARGTTFNATIGQITDGGGGAVTLPPMAEAVALAGDDFNRFFLYSPIDGIAEVRERWRVWQRRWAPETVPSTLPIVSAGLTHGLSIAADLFAGEGRTVVVPSPFWGNYRQIFAVRHGARIVGVPGHDNGRYLPEAIAGGLAALPAGEPAVAILNIPSNPGGYSPTVAERRALAASLVAAVPDTNPPSSAVWVTEVST